jgi:hypothetical protein
MSALMDLPKHSSPQRTLPRLLLLESLPSVGKESTPWGFHCDEILGVLWVSDQAASPISEAISYPFIERFFSFDPSDSYPFKKMQKDQNLSIGILEPKNLYSSVESHLRPPIRAK